MSTFDPTIAELVSRGATASLLLDAQTHLSNECVEFVLKRIDAAVSNEDMTADRALGMVHEIAAFRRIIARQKHSIASGKAAAVRQENGS